MTISDIYDEHKEATIDRYRYKNTSSLLHYQLFSNVHPAVTLFKMKLKKKTKTNKITNKEKNQN